MMVYGKQSVFVLPSKQNSIVKYNLENIILKDNLFSHSNFIF